MQQAIEAGVHQHARALAETWRKFFQLLCGEQLCQQINLEKPPSINVVPSKILANDITEQEFKIELCHGLAEKMGLNSLLKGQFRAYPHDASFKIRVKGTEGFTKFGQIFIPQLRSIAPRWAEGFIYPTGRYD